MLTPSVSSSTCPTPGPDCPKTRRPPDLVRSPLLNGARHRRPAEPGAITHEADLERSAMGGRCHRGTRDDRTRRPALALLLGERLEHGELRHRLRDLRIGYRSVHQAAVDTVPLVDLRSREVPGAIPFWLPTAASSWRFTVGYRATWRRRMASGGSMGASSRSTEPHRRSLPTNRTTHRRCRCARVRGPEPRVSAATGHGFTLAGDLVEPARVNAPRSGRAWRVAHRSVVAPGHR